MTQDFAFPTPWLPGMWLSLGQLDTFLIKFKEGKRFWCSLKMEAASMSWAMAMVSEGGGRNILDRLFLLKNNCPSSFIALKRWFLYIFQAWSLGSISIPWGPNSLLINPFFLSKKVRDDLFNFLWRHPFRISKNLALHFNSKQIFLLNGWINMRNTLVNWYVGPN